MEFSRRAVLKGGLTAGGVALATSLTRSVAAADPAKGRRVAVFGAGPAGMTAAHELAERGFQVHVYERQERLGGMVRSYVTPGGGTGGRPSMPTTCGGHYLIPGYASLPDMLMRIPDGNGRKVMNHLTSAAGADGVEIGLDGRRIGFSLPITPAQLQHFSFDDLLRSVGQAAELVGDMWPSDAPLLAGKIAALVSSGPRRQAAQLENIDLRYGFFRSELLSPPAMNMIRAFSDTISWDSTAHGVSPSAYTKFWIDPVVHMIFGRRSWPGFDQMNTQLLGLNAMLDGPETEIWFDPWARYLRGLGVTFHTQRTLTDIGVEAGRIAGATVRDPQGGTESVDADWYVVTLTPNQLLPLLSAELLAADTGLGDIKRLESAAESGFEVYFRDPLPFGRIAIDWNDWGLTLVGLSTIWNLNLQDYGDGGMRGMMSVEFNNHPYYDQPGLLYGKPIRELGYDQAFDEIREHIVRHLPDGPAMFAGGNLAGWRPHPTLTYAQGSGWTVPDLRTAAAPGTAQFYPDQVRAIPNLFLAGGYTKNSTGGDSMESAAESGKRAAQAILGASGVNEHAVFVPDYSPPPELAALRAEDDRRFSAGLPNVFDTIAPALMPKAQ